MPDKEQIIEQFKEFCKGVIVKNGPTQPSGKGYTTVSDMLDYIPAFADATQKVESIISVEIDKLVEDHGEEIEVPLSKIGKEFIDQFFNKHKPQ